MTDDGRPLFNAEIAVCWQVIDEYDEKSKKQEEKFLTDEGIDMDMNTTGFSLKILKTGKFGTD